MTQCKGHHSYSASEVTTIWRYTNVYIIIIIIIMNDTQQKAVTVEPWTPIQQLLYRTPWQSLSNLAHSTGNKLCLLSIMLNYKYSTRTLRSLQGNRERPVFCGKVLQSFQPLISNISVYFAMRQNYCCCSNAIAVIQYNNTASKKSTKLYC